MYTQSIKRKEKKRKEKKRRKVCSIRSEQTTCRDTLQESLSFFEVRRSCLVDQSIGPMADFQMTPLRKNKEERSNIPGQKKNQLSRQAELELVNQVAAEITSNNVIPTSVQLSRRGVIEAANKLFVKFAFRQSRRGGGNTSKRLKKELSREFRNDILHTSLQDLRLKTRRFSKKDEEQVIDIVHQRLRHLSVKREEAPACQAWHCLVGVKRTCKRGTYWARLKLFCSTVFAYFDTVSDVFVLLAVITLVGEVESRRFWIWLCLWYIIAPTIGHSYYLSCCEGWRDRSVAIRIKDLLLNLSFLRPLIELVKSCQVSIDLIDYEEELKKELKDLAPQEEGLPELIDDELRIGLNVTDDFKSESFVIFKVFELCTETIPQVFLQSLVLITIWNNWRTNFHWGMIDPMNKGEDSTFCSDQSIFFISLAISAIQFGVTLQDLLERDIPFGVFPHVIALGMRQKFCCNGMVWMLIAIVYYIVDVAARLLSWIPLTVIYGFKTGFAVVYAFVLALRFLVVFVVLADCKLNGMENFKADHRPSVITRNHSKEEQYSDDIMPKTREAVAGDDDSSSDSDDERTPNINIKVRGANTSNMLNNLKPSSRSQRIINKGFNVFHFNAILAESLPWTMLSVFVCLPFSMRWLREYSLKDTTSANSRYSSRYFITINILSVVENVVMCFFYMHYTSNDKLDCALVDEVRAKKLQRIDQNCGQASINTTYRECTVKGWGQSRNPESFFEFWNTEEMREANVGAIQIVLGAKIFLAVLFYFLVWGYKGRRCMISQEIAEETELHSITMIGIQNHARQESQSFSAAKPKRKGSSGKNKKKLSIFFFFL